MKKVNEKMTIREVLDAYPQAEEILAKHLGHCVTCPSANMETLALGAELHEKDVKEIIDEINKDIEKNKK